MHLVLVTPTYLPTQGGTEYTIFEWVTRLKNRYAITIVTPRKEKSWKNTGKTNDVAITTIFHCKIRGIGFFLNNAILVYHLCVINYKNKIDIIHHCHVYDLGLGVTIYKLLFKKPVINSLLGWDTYNVTQPVHKRAYPYMSFVMNNADIVVTMTRDMIASARIQGCKKDIRIIPHGSSIINKKSSFNIRSKHSIADTAKIVFSLQRFHHRKGVNFLIDAIPAIISRYPDILFIIGGFGEEENALKQQSHNLNITEKVLFPGFVSPEDQPSYYEQSTLFVLPTLYETFGLVYVDALAKGLPVVTTNNGGSRDMITPETGPTNP
jgi:glycosyltransferase involved in cell wall biosynthesis